MCAVDGHHTWSEDEIAAFEAHHPIGSKARLALALGLYTAQRRGDVVRMGRQHIRNGELMVRQSKTGTPLLIPVLPELAAIIDATPTGHLTLLVTARAMARTILVSNSESGAMTPAYRPSARSTACARRH
jgi:integrase